MCWATGISRGSKQSSKIRHGLIGKSPFSATVGAKRVCAETTSFQHAETRATEELEICVPEVGVMPWAAIYQNVNMSLHDGSDGNLKRGY